MCKAIEKYYRLLRYGAVSCQSRLTGGLFIYVLLGLCLTNLLTDIINYDTLSMLIAHTLRQKEIITMLTAQVFQSDNGQAIRLPKEIHIKEKEFFIRQSGNCYFLVPTDDPRALLNQSLGQVRDLVWERDQPFDVKLSGGIANVSP